MEKLNGYTVDEIMENITNGETLHIIREALELKEQFESDDIEVLDELADEISCKRQHIEYDEKE